VSDTIIILLFVDAILFHRQSALYCLYMRHRLVLALYRMFTLARLGLFVSLEFEESVLASSGRVVGGVSFPNNALCRLRIDLSGGDPSLSQFFASCMFLILKSYF
jgi:hypothetical protein